MPGFNSSSVRSINSTHIVCTLPPFTQEEKRVAIRVYDTVAAAYVAGAVPFSFVEGISFLSQTEGPASGGTPLQVYGVGFNASLKYTLIFKSKRDGVTNTASSVRATFVNRTHLNVTTPRWNFPFAVTDVELATDGVTNPRAGSVTWRFVEIVTAMLPPSGLVFGTFISFRLLHHACIDVHAC